MFVLATSRREYVKDREGASCRKHPSPQGWEGGLLGSAPTDALVISLERALQIALITSILQKPLFLNFKPDSFPLSTSLLFVTLAYSQFY